MRKLFLFFTLLLITAAFACDKDSTGPDDSHILPLALGNSWTFSVYTIHTDGTTTSVHTETTEIISSTVIEGETWYIPQFIQGDDTLGGITTTFWTNRGNGLYEMKIPDHPEPYLLYKYPAQKGEAYSLPFTTETIAQIKSIDTLVDVPYGNNFKCYHYNIADGSIIDAPVSDHFLKPNLGFVLKRTYGGFTGIKYVWVLEEATLLSQPIPRNNH